MKAQNPAAHATFLHRLGLSGPLQVSLAQLSEYRTPAIYHATRAILCRLDAVQTRFLKDIGVDEVTALTVFHLAPLCARRDMALLGFIHRTVLGKGPDQFREFFKLEDQSMALQDPRRTSKPPPNEEVYLGADSHLQFASS